MTAVETSADRIRSRRYEGNAFAAKQHDAWRGYCRVRVVVRTAQVYAAAYLPEPKTDGRGRRRARRRSR